MLSLLKSGKQIGSARVITDRAVIAYLADVFVVPEYRGKGLGTWLAMLLLLNCLADNLRVLFASGKRDSLKMKHRSLRFFEVPILTSPIRSS